MLSPRGFLPNFMLLAVLSGITISMGKIVTTLFALHLGASGWQLGLIATVESLAMALVTLPAGHLIARFGARRVYALSSIGPLLLNLLLPLTSLWYALLAVRGLIGLCIPFRIVAMNSSFLEQMQQLGPARAGWYRASQSTGMGLLGPLLAAALAPAGFAVAFVAVAAAFALLALYGQSVLPHAASTVDTGPRTPWWPQMRALLRQPGIAESCSVEVLGNATQALFGTFIIASALQVQHLPQALAVRLLLAQGATNVLGLFLLGGLVAGLSRRRGYAIALTLALLAMLLLGTAGGFWQLAAGGVLLSAGLAVNHVLNVQQIGRHPGGKSHIASLYNLAGMSGNALGGLLGGGLSALLGLRWLYLGWIPLLLLCAALIACNSQRRGSAG